MTLFLLFGAALAGVLLWAFDGSGGRQKEVRVWRGWRGSDRSDFALARDFLARDGIELHRYRSREAFPGKHDAVLLEEHLPDRVRKAALLTWLDNGGLLVLPGGHPLAEEFKMQFVSSDLPSAETRLQWTTAQGAILGPQTKLTQRLQWTQPPGSGLHSGTYQGTGKQTRFFAAVWDYGRGRVALLGHDFSLWHNHDGISAGTVVDGYEPVPLARGDNAAYLHDILQGRRSVLLVERGRLQPASAPWRSWLKQELWPLAVAGVLLTLAFLWHFGRRFGPLQTTDTKAGCDIEHHLQAAGGYWVREEGYRWLAERVHEQLLAQLHTHKRRYGDGAALLAVIARQSGLTEAAASAVLNGASVRNEQDFLLFIHDIEQIRRVL